MPSSIGIGRVLHNIDGGVFVSFSENVRMLDSNEASVLAILAALQISAHFFHGSLIVETRG